MTWHARSDIQHKEKHCRAKQGVATIERAGERERKKEREKARERESERERKRDLDLISCYIHAVSRAFSA